MKLLRQTGNRRNRRNEMLRKYRLLAIPLLIILFFAGCATRIGPGRVGIKVDLAGSQRGVEQLPIRTGWVFYSFVSSTIVEYPTSVETAKWTRDPNEGSANNEEMSFNTKDGLTVYGDLSVSYHLDASKVPAFYVKFRNDDINQFTHGFLRNVARDAINRTGSQYTVQEVMGEKKSELEQNSRMELQKQVGDIGVVIDQFGFIGSPRPPQSVIDAINAKVQAQQIAVQKQNELVQSQADAANGLRLGFGRMALRAVTAVTPMPCASPASRGKLTAPAFISAPSAASSSP